MEHQSTVLIVDDQESGRMTLEALLLNQGYNLVLAENGPEALDLANRLSPDVILLDVMMPGMDGFQVCRQLRATPRTKEMPVILVTALSDRDSRLQGLEAGADEFISKPFDRIELRTRIRTITRLNRYRRLQTERAKFEWVVEQAEEGYLLIDNTNHLLYANPKGRLYLGLSESENEPKTATFFELASKHYQFHPAVAWEDWLINPGKEDVRYLVRPETETAQPFWLQVDLLEMSGSIDEGRIVRLRDVTDQMAFQQDRRGFQSMVYHKLRTPLIGMLSGLELLAASAAELSAEEITEVTQLALKSVHRLHHDIEDILQYVGVSGLSKTGIGFDFAHFPRMINQISKDLELDERVAVTGVDTLAHSQTILSPQAIEMIVRELLENAKKFHPDQSPMIEIIVTWLSDQTIRLKIVDDGINLAPEQLAHAWTPYFQGEKYFTGQASGMGLGLSMVSSLVWGVGGACQLYNRSDRPGVVVELTLPVMLSSDTASALDDVRAIE